MLLCSSLKTTSPLGWYFLAGLEISDKPAFTQLSGHTRLFQNGVSGSEVGK